MMTLHQNVQLHPDQVEVNENVKRKQLLINDKLDPDYYYCSLMVNAAAEFEVSSEGAGSVFFIFFRI